MTEPTKKETAEPTDRETVRIVFIGMYRTDKGKRGYEWYFLPKDYQNDGKPISIQKSDIGRYDGKPFVVGPSPGVICAIQQSTASADANVHSVFPGTAHIVDYWKCEEQVAKWKAKHAAVGLAFDAERLSKGREDLELLEPLRTLYGQLKGRNKDALLLNIISYIKKR
jgi:hypothetical protein